MLASTSAALSRGAEEAIPEIPEVADVRLLASVLGEETVGARALAAAVLASCGGAAGLLFASRSQLLSAGLTPQQAERVRASVGLAMRAATAPPPRGRVGRAEAIALLRPGFATVTSEELHALYLGADGTFLGRERIARGGPAALVVGVREILGPALEARATVIAIAHNHPSGSCAPSPEDVSLSERLEAGAKTVGLRLADHLVFARDGVASAMPAGPHWPRGGACRSV